MNQEAILSLLDNLYEKSLDGVPKVSKPINVLAEEYLSKNENVEDAAKSFVNNQIAKCTTTGFITGFGGVVTLPITIPADVSGVLYVQMRMIATLAYMGGYEVNSDQVQTLVYACLAGVGVSNILRKAGIELGGKFANNVINKIPGKVLTSINQKVGFRFVTKAGTKGIINLHKLIPVVGGFVSGGFDLVDTKIIASRAYKMFLKNDFSYEDNFDYNDCDNTFEKEFDNE